MTAVIPAGDDIEQALLSARALVDAAISNHRRRSSPPVVELPTDEAMMGGTVRRLVALTRSQLLCVPSPARYRPDVARQALADMGRLARRGIAVRMLCAADSPVEFLASAAAHGIQARVSESPLPELLMADDRVALIRPTGSRAAVAYLPSILHALSALFTSTWQHARPAGSVAVSSLARDVLECLCAGQKDDAAARKLGLSVRTYRRHVADLLRDLGVESRFQAGVRAAELRLLPGSAESAVHVQHRPGDVGRPG